MDCILCGNPLQGKAKKYCLECAKAVIRERSRQQWLTKKSIVITEPEPEPEPERTEYESGLSKLHRLFDEFFEKHYPKMEGKK
jgi:hypothetical protein